MEPRSVELPFPHGGISEEAGYAEQPPLSSPDLVNVRRMGPLEYRKRGGSRPGLTKAFNEQLESGSRIEMLTSVSYVASGDVAWSDQFDGTELDAVWSAASWVANGAVGVGAGTARTFTSPSTGAKEQGVVRAAYSVDTAGVYFVEMFLVPYQGVWCGKYKLWARMNNSTPNVETSGVEAELVMTGSSGSYTGTLRVDGVAVATWGPATKPVEGAWFKMRISGNEVKVRWAGTLLTTQTVTAHGVNTRAGFGFEATYQAPGYSYGICMADSFQIRSVVTETGHRNRLICSANGKLYRESEDQLILVATAGDLQTGAPLMAAEHLQKLYIANYSKTATVNAKVYDPIANTMANVTATAGSWPTNCPLLCRYSDRLVWAGEKANPHVWYMSRQGTPTDYDYAQTDDQSAIAGIDSAAGTVGEPLRGILPVGDDYMMMGCLRSMWVMRGDPGYGGRIENISREVGLLGQFAHCMTPDDYYVFMSKDGLYALGPGAQGEVEQLSRARMPNKWLGLDPEQVFVSMCFSVEEYGIHVFVTDKNSGPSKHYFMDWQAKAFLRDEWPVTMDPITAHVYASFALPQLSGKVLMGCRDGYVRMFSPSAGLDDGTEIQSHVYIGPVPLGHEAGMESVLNEIVATLPVNGGAVDWSIHVGNAPEDAFKAAAAASGTWTSRPTHGVQYRERPRVRGGAAFLRLANGEVGAPWSIERIHGTVLPGGMQRLS